MKPYEERLEAYAKLKEQHPDENLSFFADHFGVNMGTVSRWNKALKKLDIKGEALDELRTQIEKEMEAKYKGIFENQEQAREEAAAKKAAAEKLKSENRRDHFRRILNECARETIVTSKDEDITWQGHQFHIKGGVPTEVPEVIAGVLRDALKARGQSTNTIARYQSGQYLGRM